MIDFGIIASGSGSRLRDGGEILPKPLVDIAGKPMIERLINIMKVAGAERVNIVVNSDMMEVVGFLDFLQDELKLPFNIITRKTESSLHTFYELMTLMKPSGKFIVSTVDSVFGQDAFLGFVSKFKQIPDNTAGLMAVSDYINDEKPLYVETDTDMRITAFKDDPFSGVKFVSAGVYGLKTDCFDLLSQCMASGIKKMRNFQRKLIDEGMLLKAFNLGRVIDVDHPADLKIANDFFNPL